MTRVVQPEWLDALPVDHRLARGSRRDLRRINALMGHHLLWRRLLRPWLRPESRDPLRIADLGCGDGSLWLSLPGPTPPARPGRPTPELWLLDRNPSVSSGTRRRLESAGWRVQIVPTAAETWLAQETRRWSLIVCNLFLHHFPGPALAGLLEQIQGKTDAFLACEPRRCGRALAGVACLGLVGCNRVTRQDGLVSVRAGFSDRELSSLWPRTELWELEERPAGLFSHLFSARRL